MPSHSNRSTAAGPWARRTVGIVIATALAVLGSPLAASAAAPDPGTVSWEGDGFVNASELDSNIPAHWVAGDLTATDATGFFKQTIDGSEVALPVDCGPFALPHTGSGYLNSGCAHALEEGAFTFDVVWHNGDGDSEAVSAPYVKDTIAPGLAEISFPAAGAPTNGRFSGTAEPGSTVDLSIGAVSVGTATAGEDGAWELDADTDSLVDGDSYLAVAQVTDLAGNAGAPTDDHAFVLDLTAPEVPEFTFPAPGAPTNGRFAGLAGAGDVVELTLSGSSIGSATADGAGAWELTADVGDLEEGGPYTVSAQATDSAGNVGEASADHEFVYDISPPARPSITTPARTGPGEDHDPVKFATSTVNFEGTGEPGARIRIRDRATDTLLAVTHANAGGTWTKAVPFPGDATYSVIARADDAAGNTSVRTPIVNVLIDTVAPVAGTVAQTTGGDGVINATEAAADMAASWTAADTGAEDVVSATVWYEQAGVTPAACGPTTVDASSTTGSLSQSCAAALTEGAFTFNATWTDHVGNVSPVASDSAVLDRVGPAATIEIIDADRLISPDEQGSPVPVSWTVAEAGPAVVISVANAGQAAPDACVSGGQPRSHTGAITVDCLALLEHGPVVASVIGQDAAGNTSTATDEVSFRGNAGAFGVTVVGSSSNPETGLVDTVLNAAETADGKALQVRVDLDEFGDVYGEVQALVEVRDQGGDPAGQYLVQEGAISPTDEPEDRTFTFDVATAEFAPGPITVEVTIEDGFGLVSSAKREVTLDLAAPVTTWKTENEAEFLSFSIPFLGGYSNVKFEGTTADPSGVSGIQWVYLVARDSGGRVAARHAKMALPERPNTAWALDWALPPGTWDVTARTGDTAGNVDQGPTIRVYVDGLL